MQARNYLPSYAVPADLPQAVFTSALFTFAIKAVFTNVQMGLTYSAVAALAAGINVLVNPLLKKMLQTRQLDFVQDAAVKIVVLYVAKALLDIALPGVRHTAMLGGLIAYLVIKGLLTNFSSIDLSRADLWIIL